MAVAVVLRVLVLWDDPYAHGYDGYYYVLQVRSMLAGAPLFADTSFVYLFLSGLALLIGDVVVANKVAACLFAAVTAISGAVAATRWTGSDRAGLATGLWWAASPLHLAVSSEFLKNQGGLAVLAVLIAVVARPIRSKAGWGVVAGLVAVGLMSHKLTGVLGVLLVAVLVAHALYNQHARRIGWALIGGVLALGTAASLGVLRVVDLSRFIEGAARSGDRTAALVDGRLSLGEKVSLALVYLTPLALLVLARWWRMLHLRPLSWALLPIAVACTAPLLPMGYDLTAWRLMLMGFVPLGLVFGVAASKSRWVLPVLVLASLVLLPDTVRRRQQREPDYVGWAQVLPILTDTISPGERIVAHRGLCGFIWAQTDIVCENFQPTGDLLGWWRVTYGIGGEQLAPYGLATPLRPAYFLIREPAYQRFREQHLGEYILLTDPRNPYEVRPGFVYGPQEAP